MKQVIVSLLCLSSLVLSKHASAQQVYETEFKARSTSFYGSFPYYYDKSYCVSYSSGSDYNYSSDADYNYWTSTPHLRDIKPNKPRRRPVQPKRRGKKNLFDYLHGANTEPAVRGLKTIGSADIPAVGYLQLAKYQRKRKTKCRRWGTEKELSEYKYLHSMLIGGPFLIVDSRTFDKGKQASPIARNQTFTIKSKLKLKNFNDPSNRLRVRMTFENPVFKEYNLRNSSTLKANVILKIDSCDDYYQRSIQTGLAANHILDILREQDPVSFEYCSLTVEKVQFLNLGKSKPFDAIQALIKPDLIPNSIIAFDQWKDSIKMAKVTMVADSLFFQFGIQQAEHYSISKWPNSDTFANSYHRLKRSRTDGGGRWANGDVHLAQFYYPIEADQNTEDNDVFLAEIDAFIAILNEYVAYLDLLEQEQDSTPKTIAKNFFGEQSMREKIGTNLRRIMRTAKTATLPQIISARRKLDYAIKVVLQREHELETLVPPQVKIGARRFLRNPLVTRSAQE